MIELLVLLNVSLSNRISFAEVPNLDIAASCALDRVQLGRSNSEACLHIPKIPWTQIRDILKNFALMRIVASNVYGLNASTLHHNEWETKCTLFHMAFIDTNSFPCLSHQCLLFDGGDLNL